VCVGECMCLCLCVCVCVYVLSMCLPVWFVCERVCMCVRETAECGVCSHDDVIGRA